MKDESSLPTFTVLITTYNRLDFLQRAIQSVQNQTYPAHQILVCDDCSTDGTKEYCQSLGNTIQYVQNPSNLGHSATVNVGIQQATGTWIKFLDDDDFLHQECLERFKDAISMYPESVIASCRRIVTKNREIPVFPKYIASPIRYIEQKKVHQAMLLEQACFGETSRVAVKTSTAKLTEGWKTEFNYAFDEIEFWVRIAQFGPAIFILTPLVYYYQWEGGYSQKYSFSEMLQRNIEIKKKIYSCLIPTTFSFSIVEHYLHLHWGLLAIRHRKWKEGVCILWKSWFHIRSWVLLIQTKIFRHRYQ